MHDLTPSYGKSVLSLLQEIRHHVGDEANAQLSPSSNLFVVAADSSPSLEQARVVMDSESFKGGHIEVCFTGGHGVRSKRGNGDGSRNQFDSLNPSNDLSSMGIPECTMHQKMRFDDIGADARWLQRSHFLITPTDDAVLRETWTEKTIDDLISKQTMMIQIILCS